MGEPVTINLRHVARGLGIPVGQIQEVVSLLDEGNTVPFITRYRKDQTGGLDEEQIRQIQSRLTKLRMLAERKETILRSIESQGKLTEKLSKNIHGAGTTKRLEDLYLPYKPKKQTLATLARSRGLETLADEIIEARPECTDLDARAADFVNPDRQVPTAADALLGAGHILAERFSERAELRQRLREVLQRSGKLVSSRIGEETKPAGEKPRPPAPKPADAAPSGSTPSEPKPPTQKVADTGWPPAPEVATPEPSEVGPPEPQTSTTSQTPEPEQPPTEAIASEPTPPEAAEPESTTSQTPEPEQPPTEVAATEPTPSEVAVPEPATTETTEDGEADLEHTDQPQPTLVDEQPADAVTPPPSGDDQSAGPDTTEVKGEPEAGEPDQQGSGQGGGEEDGDTSDTRRPPTKPEEVAETPQPPQPTAEPEEVSQATGKPQALELTPPPAEQSEPPPEPVSAAGSPAQVQEPAPATEAASQEPAPDHPETVPTREASPPSEAESQPPTPEQPQPAPSPAQGSASADPSPAPQPSPQARAKKQAAGQPRKPAARRSKSRRGASKKEQKKKARERIEKAFSDYFDYGEELKKIPPHRILAINRGERAKVLRVKLECDIAAMHGVLDELCLPEENPHADFLRGCARDALARLILPSLERELRRELTDRSELHAVGVFARNLRNLLLQPPVNDRRILAVDPGYRSGCKLVALDQFGNVLAHDVIFLVGKAERKEKARRIIAELVERYKLTVVTIGNGSACREAEDFFAELIVGELKDRDLSYVIVNEAGASVYSTSRLGREEFPNYDATLRGAVSIGRRLQDPLSELVKIDPANIGVGLYQHDVKAKHLRASLDEVVESCVNYVGVDVNTASPALLRYVSGLNQLTARRICEHRLANGPFRNREQLKEVPGFGDATFVQGAGFLKISSGDNPLDATWIHPESYEVADRVIADGECDLADLAGAESLGKLAERLSKVDVAATAEKLEVGSLLLKDIISQLTRPGRDPREDLPPPIFKRGVLKLDDLTPGMELTGTVLNVVDFGAFVDIGMHDSGLVHVSQLADKFVRDPHDFAAVGDIVKVWVVEVDKSRRRVSLTMIPPGAQRPPRKSEEKSEGRPPSRRSSKPQGDRRPKGKRPPQSRGRGPSQQYRPKVQPKPVKPITKAMKAGREPMRSFSDLSQFLGVVKVDPADDKKSKKKKKKEKKEKEKKEDAGNQQSKPESEKQAEATAASSDQPQAPPPDASNDQPQAPPPDAGSDQPQAPPSDAKGDVQAAPPPDASNDAHADPPVSNDDGQTEPGVPDDHAS